MSPLNPESRNWPPTMKRTSDRKRSMAPLKQTSCFLGRWRIPPKLWHGVKVARRASGFDVSLFRNPSAGEDECQAHCLGLSRAHVTAWLDGAFELCCLQILLPNHPLPTCVTSLCRSLRRRRIVHPSPSRTENHPRVDLPVRAFRWWSWRNVPWRTWLHARRLWKNSSP